MRPVHLLARPVRVAALCGGLLLATVLGPFAMGLATAQDDGDVEDLRQEREDNRREAADVAAAIDELGARDEELIEAIEALDAHISLQEGRVAAAEASIADAERRAADARADATALGSEMDAIRDRLRLRAIEVFVSPRLDTIEQLNNADLLEAEIKKTYVDEVIDDEYQLIDRLRTAQSAQDEARRVAQEAADEAETERAALADRLADLDLSRGEAEALRAAVEDRIGEWQAVGREIEAADATITEQIRELEAELARQAAAAEEARRLAEEDARRQALADEQAAETETDTEEADTENDDTEAEQPPVDLGPFAVTHRPVPGAVSSVFGPRVHPIFGTVRNHFGLDFRAGAGDNISAAADGVVLTAGWMNGYGWTVVLSHGDGFTTLYAHQSALLVETGDSVSGGDTIGQIGSSGWSTGPHLHWEIRVDGVAVDPANYL